MELLTRCYIFEGLSQSQLDRLAAVVDEVHVEEGQWVLQEGHEGHALYLLKEGAVELITKVDGDFELPMAMLRDEGTCFGTSSLVVPHVYSLSARCAEKGTLLVIKRADLESLVQEDQSLGCSIMKNYAAHLLKRLKETRQELKIHFKTLFKSMHS
jgi:CRP-like cAMP-binding protein